MAVGDLYVLLPVYEYRESGRFKRVEDAVAIPKDLLIEQMKTLGGVDSFEQFAVVSESVIDEE